MSIQVQASRSTEAIRTRPNPTCYLCGRRGRTLYERIEDRLFGASGRWNFKACADPGCGLIWLDPVPIEEDLHRAYQTYYTHESPAHPRGASRIFEAVRTGYLRVRFGYVGGVGLSSSSLLAPLAWFHPGGGEEIAFGVAFQKAPRPGARLLDVGCGSGRLLSTLRDLGWDVAGVEPDPRAVRAARSNGLDVRSGDLTDREFPDEHFDVVHLGNVIEHVYDPIATLGECRRILKPGGKLVVVTPNMAGWGHRRFGPDYYQLDPPRHLILFHPENLDVVIRRAGFVTEGSRTLSQAARTVLVVSAKFRSARRAGSDWDRRQGVAWKVRGILEQILERALLLARPRAGEEILCIARKA